MTRKLTQGFLDQFFKFWGITYALKDFPEILFHRTTQPLEIGVSLNSFSERWRLHLDHEKGCTNAENISLLTVVFWIHGEVPYLAIDGYVVKNAVVILRLHFALIFLQVDFIVPKFGSVVDFRAYIGSLINNWIIIFLENSITIRLFHSCCEAKVCDNYSSLFIDKQILWLDVSMYNAIRMEILHALEQLIKDIPDHWLIKPVSVLNKAIELTILSQFHHVVTKRSLSFYREVVIYLAFVYVLRYLVR